MPGSHPCGRRVGPEAIGECSAIGCDIDYFGATPTSGVPIDLQEDGSSFFWGGAALSTMPIPPVIW